jgi:peptide/nickel transport system permease protein
MGEPNLRRDGEFAEATAGASVATAATDSADEQLVIDTGMPGPGGPQATKKFIGRSPGQLAWARLKRDRTARSSFVVLVIFILIGVLAPVIEWLVGGEVKRGYPDLLDRSGMPLGYYGGIDWTTNNSSGLVHLLGVTPNEGTDLFLQLVYGVRTSLIVAASATVVAAFIGVILGTVAGYFGGWLDQLLSWVIDYFLAFPFLLMAIAVIPVVNTHLQDSTGDVSAGERITTIIVVFSLFAWMGTARLVRGQVISLREREYVDAARAAGAKGAHIMFKQILPNLWAPILVTFCLALPATVTAEAALSFLGIGVQHPTPDWGWSINDSINYMRSDPAYLVIPGVSILAFVLAFNLFGDALRDALDPKSAR